MLLFIVPETPRFLVSKNKDEEAFNILAKINGSTVLLYRQIQKGQLFLWVKLTFFYVRPVGSNL
jgi:hypothetical protein